VLTTGFAELRHCRFGQRQGFLIGLGNNPHSRTIWRPNPEGDFIAQEKLLHNKPDGFHLTLSGVETGSVIQPKAEAWDREWERRGR
jgi:hypothetical protein